MSFCDENSTVRGKKLIKSPATTWTPNNKSHYDLSTLRPGFYWRWIYGRQLRERISERNRTTLASDTKWTSHYSCGREWKRVENRENENENRETDFMAFLCRLVCSFILVGSEREAQEWAKNFSHTPPLPAAEVREKSGVITLTTKAKAKAKGAKRKLTSQARQLLPKTAFRRVIKSMRHFRWAHVVAARFLRSRSQT